MNENGSMVMPVAPAYGGMGNSGFGGWGSDIWLILIVLFAMGGFGGMGWGGGFGGGFGNMYEFPWLLNGQQNVLNGVNANTNSGFNQAATQAALGDISNAITGGFGNVQTSLCSGFAGVNATVNNAQNALAQQMYTNQIADMERSFAAQTANTNGLNNISAQLAQCCCDNRLATCQTQNVVQSEGSATRFADANNTRDIIENANRNNQAILDKLCQLELDGFKRENDQLRSQLQFANMQASQVAQTAEIRTNNATVANQLVAELRSCPIPSQPVYGNQPIFTCPQNYSNCGCNNF